MPSDPKMTAIEKCIKLAIGPSGIETECVMQARKELAALMKCREACREEHSRDHDKYASCMLCNADDSATEAGL